MDKTLGILRRAAVAALLLLLAGAASALDRVTVDPGDSPSLGPPGAPLRIIEFVDYQ